MTEFDRIGNYTPIDSNPIGEGSSSVILKVENAEQEIFAIKIINKQYVSEKDKERYQREASILKKLQHPGIVSIYDEGVYRTRPYIILKYATGGDLRKKYPGILKP